MEVVHERQQALAFDWRGRGRLVLGPRRVSFIHIKSLLAVGHSKCCIAL